MLEFFHGGKRSSGLAPLSKWPPMFMCIMNIIESNEPYLNENGRLLGREIPRWKILCRLCLESWGCWIRPEEHMVGYNHACKQKRPRLWLWGQPTDKGDLKPGDPICTIFYKLCISSMGTEGLGNTEAMFYHVYTRRRTPATFIREIRLKEKIDL